ncbi:MAG: class I SAM-dependent methyltransferase [Sphingobacteriaceae bacterium]|nr:class I SAM-dependent methyltransferase [Sphingobacteriaceae bacterium]MBK7818942.1 class I SAM-dependent methyltransferase [Sphingobacteriaceae bacterium]
MDDIYNNQNYLSNNPLWHQEDSAFKAGLIHSILEENKIAYTSICEVGCGTGEILVQLQQLNSGKQISYCGYDISKDAIEMAQKKNSGIEFKCADFTKETTNSEVLLVIDVIEHLHDYFSFLKSISKKSKYTVFHIPLDMFVWSLFREQMLIESKERVGHIHNFSEGFILSILKDFGYTIISKQYTEPDYRSNSFKKGMINGIKQILFKIAPRFTTKTLGGYSVLVLCKN